MKQESNSGEWEAIRGALADRDDLRATLDGLFAGADPAAREEFLEQVDSSDYSLVDWAEALDGFDGWLHEQGVADRPVREMVGYVHCCTLTNAPGIDLPSLKVIVSQCLIDFGFEAISESRE